VTITKNRENWYFQTRGITKQELTQLLFGRGSGQHPGIIRRASVNPAKAKSLLYLTF
jgi:hypothetical protein